MALYLFLATIVKRVMIIKEGYHLVCTRDLEVVIKTPIEGARPNIALVSPSEHFGLVSFPCHNGKEGNDN